MVRMIAGGCGDCMGHCICVDFSCDFVFWRVQSMSKISAVRAEEPPSAPPLAAPLTWARHTLNPLLTRLKRTLRHCGARFRGIPAVSGRKLQICERLVTP
jgi:hypothetical protein